LLAVNGYIPHGYCLSWSPPLVVTFVISDVLIFLSYMSMPVALGYFARKREDFPYRWLLWLFSAFILACGATHLMGAIVLYKPMYAFDALLKACTAAISVVTAIVLWPLLPQALKLPSPMQLKKANEALQNEISHRRQVEEELRLAHNVAKSNLERNVSLLAAIVESSGDAIIGKTPDGIVTSWNRAAERIFGYTAEEMIGHSVLSLLPAERQQEEQNFLGAVARGESIYQFETERIRKDGRLIDVSFTISPIRNLQNQIIGVSATARDISERKRAESQIERLAFSDPLTGLPNRRLLMDRLERALVLAHRNQQLSALLFIDLDNFKMVNDTLGHDTGDVLLKDVAMRLKSCVREGDTVARLGGDEFVVLLENLNGGTIEATEQSGVVGSKILTALSKPYQLDSHEQYGSASIGVTLFGADRNETVEELLKRSELAMYDAKAAGRNVLRFFEQEMKAVVSARVQLEEGLRHALQGDQFVLYYQPQGDDINHLTGAEALVRWRHPQRGLVSPGDFIAVAEASGLILPLGRWVLHAACTQLALWAAQPGMAHLIISVNVSAREFRQPKFAEEVRHVINETGANPRRLKLELTESVLVEDVEEIISKMNVIKELGVSFSLDDFGTGYSSLSYLKRLPLDQLKIAQEFVRDILIDSNDAAIAKMVIVLAEAMGLQVIAEGVETAAQRDLLLGLGCHHYQGYLLSAPVPIETFEALFKHSA
ncbi:MAG: EAL domain-containing protein, partial [Burkholderiaceae bacterium]|nr:EAL domain-containing protein [Burkholderiaceae bacterium]